MKRNIEISNEANLPTRHGDFLIKCFKQEYKEHLVLYTKNLCDEPLVRVHSECLTGDTMGSLKCDCGEQLEFALKEITKNGCGLLIYLRQEGRGIGLLNKVNAYALQDQGLDTVEANHQLGFENDLRDYDIAEFILKYFNLKKIKLLTNNPNKLSSFKDIEIVKRIPVIVKPNKFNKEYLKVKKEKSGHLL